MESRHIRDLRDEKPGPESANGVLKALRGLFAWAVEAEYATVNPAKASETSHQDDGFSYVDP
jgi:site-specific recombinase XerD